MTNTPLPPDWTLQAALEWSGWDAALLDEIKAFRNFNCHTPIIALARMIYKYETKPVDPSRETDIRAAERDRIAAWLRGMDESTATTLANWLDAGMVYKRNDA